MEVIDAEGFETRALHALVDFEGKDVVEIGCGDGRLTWRYAAPARSVYAFDPDPDEIAAARRAMPTALRGIVTFAVADAITDPLPGASYDVAVLSYSL